MVNGNENEMVSIYGNLIIKGKRIIEQIPDADNVREDVKKWLVDNGHAELAEENV